MFPSMGMRRPSAEANMFLRTAQRVLWKVAEFEAVTFDELFERTKAVPWEDYLPENARFWVAKATSVKSKLFSPSDIQSIMKKAMVERLKADLPHGVVCGGWERLSVCGYF